MEPQNPQPAAETAEKRRKQIEKAKAAHLSRQLQTRLQYARLKVDHGWQKQTLNEVENLYFHHYRARIPARSPQKSGRKTIGTPAAQAAPELPLASDNQASTSFSNSIDQQEQSQSSKPLLDPLLTPSIPAETEPSGMEVDPPPTISTYTELINPVMTATQPQTTIPASPRVTPPTPQQHTPAPQPVAVSPGSPPPTHHPSPITPHRSPSFTAPPTSSRNSSYVQPSSSAIRPRGPSPTSRASPSQTSSSLPGSSNVALTYDSFWSSHSSTSNNYRSALANTASFSGTGRGDGSMGMPTFGVVGYQYALGAAPGAPFQPMPVAKRPSSVARKRSVPTATVRHGVGETGG